ncbi:MAG: hypothetical protein ABGX33_07615 [Cycloclasticus sp.]
MNSADLMFAIAQIAVALAGFSAIIVALNNKPIREWVLMDQINIRLLIQLSIVVIFFSLIPSLLAISISVSDVWLYSLWAYGLVHFADAAFFLFFKSKRAPTIFRVAAFCGVIVGLAQITIAWLGGDIARESMYVFTLIWHLGVIFMAFILLLYQMGHTEEVADNSGNIE